MNTSQKELLTIYALSALFSGGRLFVGAISVLYVLSFGVTIGEFAMIKSIQIATFLLFDIPSGLLIKRIGFRKSILITFIFSISGLSIYALGSNFISFLLAEFILAISLCICPAAFTDYVMQFLNRQPNILVEKVFHRNEMYTNVSNVICGLLGGYLYTFEKTIPYTAGIFVQGIGLFFAFKMIPVTSQEDKRLQSIRSFIKSSLTGLRAAHMSIAMPIFLLFIIQLTVQPLYHYWQPLFYEINHNISGTILGLLFMSYSICAIVLNFIFSKLVHFEFFRSIRCVLFLLFISSGLYFLTSLTTNEMTAFFAFTCLQGVLFTALTCLSAIMNREIENENRAVVLKSISFLSRIGMLLSFAYIQVLAFLKENNELYNEVHSLYLQSSIALLISSSLALFIYLYKVRRQNLKVTYETSSA